MLILKRLTDRRGSGFSSIVSISSFALAGASCAPFGTRRNFPPDVHQFFEIYAAVSRTEIYPENSVRPSVNYRPTCGDCGLSVSVSNFHIANSIEPN